MCQKYIRWSKSYFCSCIENCQFQVHVQLLPLLGMTYWMWTSIFLTSIDDHVSSRHSIHSESGYMVEYLILYSPVYFCFYDLYMNLGHLQEVHSNMQQCDEVECHNMRCSYLNSISTQTKVVCSKCQGQREICVHCWLVWQLQCPLWPWTCSCCWILLFANSSCRIFWWMDISCNQLYEKVGSYEPTFLNYSHHKWWWDSAKISLSQLFPDLPSELDDHDISVLGLICIYSRQLQN